MRHTQFIGLPPEALKFLEEHCEIIPDSTCHHCGGILSYKKRTEIYADAKQYGMFDDGPMLSKYYLKDGREVFEDIQCCPWSSGPMIFLCLKDKDKNILFKWDDKEIEKY